MQASHFYTAYFVFLIVHFVAFLYSCNYFTLLNPLIAEEHFPCFTLKCDSVAIRSNYFTSKLLTSAQWLLFGLPGRSPPLLCPPSPPQMVDPPPPPEPPLCASSLDDLNTRDVFITRNTFSAPNRFRGVNVKSVQVTWRSNVKHVSCESLFRERQTDLFHSMSFILRFTR